MQCEWLFGGPEASEGGSADLFSNLCFKDGSRKTQKHPETLLQVRGTVQESREQPVEGVVGEIFGGGGAGSELIAVLADPGVVDVSEPVQETDSGIRVGNSRDVEDPGQGAGVVGEAVFCHGSTG